VQALSAAGGHRPSSSRAVSMAAAIGPA